MRSVLIIAGLSLVLGANRAEADFITSVLGEINGRGFGDVATGSSFSASSASSSDGPYAAAAGYTSINGWTLTSVTTASGSDPDGVRSFGDVTSSGTRIDVLYLGSTDPNVVGHTLRLNFQAAGQFRSLVQGTEVRPEIVASGATIKTVSAYTDNNGTIDASQSAYLSSPGYENDPTGWDSLTLTPYSDLQGFTGFDYEGTFFIDIPILDSIYGGYVQWIPGSIGLTLTAMAQAGVESFGYPLTYAASTFTDPMSFISITLPDMGNVTPESLGVNLTFDSGLLSPNLASSPVPEPSSLTLLILGVISLGAASGFSAAKRKGNSK